ncbi:unnamed protein product, partial [Dovyalis caffra]
PTSQQPRPSTQPMPHASFHIFTYRPTNEPTFNVTLDFTGYSNSRLMTQQPRALLPTSYLAIVHDPCLSAPANSGIASLSIGRLTSISSTIFFISLSPLFSPTLNVIP